MTGGLCVSVAMEGGEYVLPEGLGPAMASRREAVIGEANLLAIGSPLAR